MQKLLIIAFLVVILWNLGAGLYYMMVDKGKTNRTVRSLTCITSAISASLMPA